MRAHFLNSTVQGTTTPVCREETGCGEALHHQAATAPGATTALRTEPSIRLQGLSALSARVVIASPGETSTEKVSTFHVCIPADPHKRIAGESVQLVRMLDFLEEEGASTGKIRPVCFCCCRRHRYFPHLGRKLPLRERRRLAALDFHHRHRSSFVCLQLMSDTSPSELPELGERLAWSAIAASETSVLSERSL